MDVTKMWDIRAMTIPVFTAGVLLVALDDQPDVTSHQKLHTLSTA